MFKSSDTLHLVLVRGFKEPELLQLVIGYNGGGVGHLAQHDLLSGGKNQLEQAWGGGKDLLEEYQVVGSRTCCSNKW